MIEKLGIASSEYAFTNPKEVANQLRMIADQIERFENSSNFEAHKYVDSMVYRQKGVVDFKGYVDHIINGRKIRNSILGGRFFGEPAWDILLDLFEANQTMQARCMKLVSSAAHAPLTTTLRYVDFLTDAGLVEKVNDPGDRRRTIVRLSATGEKMVAQVLERAFQKF